MAGVTYDSLQGASGSRIRKALGGFILAAPMSAEVPEKVLADADGNFTDFKSLGYVPLGWLTKSDGINFSREQEQQETESFGSLEPTRIDFTKDTTSAAFTCQETNKAVLEMYYNLDLSDVKFDANNEMSFEQERNPSTIYRRLIYIAKDGNGKDAKYVVKTMPRAILSEVSEQAWTPESEMAYGMTIKATLDEELGFAVRHTFAGPGYADLKEGMGFL